MKRKSRGKRYAADEMDLDEGFAEGNPHARRLRKKSKFPKVPRWVYRVSVILIVSVLGLFFWLNRENLTPDNVKEWLQSRVVGMGIGDGYPAAITNGNTVRNGNFLSVNKNAVMVSDTALTVLNSTAKELVRRQHSFGNPVLRAAGSRMMVYNLGGTGFQIEGHSDTIRKESASGNILSGAVAANGRYVLVTQAEGYSSKLTAFLADGTPQYIYEFSDYYVTDVALNRDGSKAAVSAISAVGGGLVSAVYQFDFNDPSPKQIFTFSECLMLSVHYGDNGTIVAVGDQLISILQEGSDKKQDYSYQGQQLLSFAVENGRAALALAPYANSDSCRLVTLDETGKETSSNNLGGQAASVSIYGNTAAVLAGHAVFAYDFTSGASIGSCPAGSDAKAVALCDESSAYILGISEIRLEKLES